MVLPSSWATALELMLGLFQTCFARLLHEASVRSCFRTHEIFQERKKSMISSPLFFFKTPYGWVGDLWSANGVLIQNPLKFKFPNLPHMTGFLLLRKKRNWNTDQELAVVEKYHHILDGWIECRVSYIPGFYIIKTSNLSSGYNGYIFHISMKHETFHVVKCWPHLRAWHDIWEIWRKEHERGKRKTIANMKNTMHLDKVNANAPPIILDHSSMLSLSEIYDIPKQVRAIQKIRTCLFMVWQSNQMT